MLRPPLEFLILTMDATFASQNRTHKMSPVGSIYTTVVKGFIINMSYNLKMWCTN
jgi:hypothetical protein